VNPTGIDGFLHRLGEVLGTLQAAPGPVHRRIWIELGPWLRTLTVEAAPKWLGRLAAELPCHVAAIEHDGARKCPRHAVALCMLCGGATCLEHAFIDIHGESICYVCATKALHGHVHHAPPPKVPRDVQSPRDVAWACRQLKVDSDVTAAELHTAHRKLSAHWHPDRYRTEQQKANAERRFKDVQRAFDILQKHLQRSAA
jgi:hypothetical protein